MGISKVILNGVTQMDVTQKTVTSENLLQGETALGADGEDVVGTMTAGGLPETPTDSIIIYSPYEFTVKTRRGTKVWNGTLQYSTDHETWNTWDGVTTLASVVSNEWHKLYLRGTGNTYVGGSGGNLPDDFGWVFAGRYARVCGNMNTLLEYSNPPLKLTSAAFSCLFYNWSNVDFDVTLPATTLANSCYRYLFCGCATLTVAPTLPATTLTNYCYSNMFYGCTSLVTPPSLPATTLAVYCYEHMFYGCTFLVTAPALPATTLANYCYQSMFRECTSLTTAPALPATTLASYCYRQMFADCSSLTTAPALPATTLETYCYYYMFQNCSLLETIPALPATTLVNYCYSYMFTNCSNIKLSATQTEEYQTEYRIPTAGTGTTASYSLISMFSSTGGTFKSTPAINTTYYTSNTVVPAT